MLCKLALCSFRSLASLWLGKGQTIKSWVQSLHIQHWNFNHSFKEILVAYTFGLLFILLFISFHFRANEEFNNAVVITSRCLKPNELLEVRVDIQVTKWAGSLEIGVTTHNPETLKFPSTMTNIEQPGTWMLSGGSIVCNGVTVIEEYGPTLDEIKVSYHICVFYQRTLQ